MIKALIITFTTLIAITNAQYWNRQSGVRPVQPIRSYGGGYGGAYGGVNRGAYGGGYQGAYGAYGGNRGFGGSYAAPGAPLSQPQYVSQPQYAAQPQYAPRYGEDESYKPYSFAYNNVDEYGTQLGRQEVADGNGAVRGSYSYRDPAGQFRQVQYEADQAGFRAVVDTNEAGVVSHKPADAVYNVHN